MTQSSTMEYPTRDVCTIYSRSKRTLALGGCAAQTDDGIVAGPILTGTSEAETAELRYRIAPNDCDHAALERDRE